MVKAGVPPSWLTFPIGTRKTAGAAGLLGLLGVPLIGTAAAVGLVLFFVCAVYTHLLARDYSIQLVLAGGLLWRAVIGLGVGALGWQTPAMLAVVRHETGPAHTSGLVMAGFFTGMLGGPVGFGWLADSSGSYALSWLNVTLEFALAAGTGTLARRIRAVR